MTAKRTSPDVGLRLADGLAVGLILALTPVFFWKLAFTDLILSGLDVFTYFYPYRAYAADVIREGQMPLWNPYLFMGVPFLANIQTAVFYPLNWPLFWFAAPRAVSLSMVGHVLLGGLFTYAFTRAALHLRPFGALVAATAFAFSGFLGAQVEHVNQLNVSAWFPLLLLLFEKARRQRSLVWGMVAGVVVALQMVAGHLQATYISLAGLGMYAVFPMGWELRSRRSLVAAAPRDKPPTRSFLTTDHEGPVLLGTWKERLLWGPGLLALVAAVGLGLAAVQLMPTLELSRLSVRAGGLPYRQAASFSLDPRLALLSLLPTYGEDVFSEYVAYVGVSALLLAAFGLRTLPSSAAKCLACVFAAAGLFLALGGYNPVYWLLYKLVPGVGLFRAPARWLFLYTFGVSCLAGLGADWWSTEAGAGLQTEPLLARSETGHSREARSETGQSREVRSKAGQSGRRILGLASALVVVAVLISPLVQRPFPWTAMMWLAAGLATLAVLYAGLHWHVKASSRGARVVLQAIMLAILVAELFLAGRHLAYNAPTAPGAFTSLRPSLLQLLADNGLHRVLSLSDTTFDPGDLPETRQMFQSQLPAEAIYDYVVATKQKEILAPNLPLLYGLQSVDGYDGGLLPLQRYVELQRVFLPDGAAAPDGRLREVLTEVPAARWLDLLNVKYVIADKVHDIWVDGVYYDLGLKAAVAPQVPLVLADLPAFPTTSLGIVSYLEGGAGIPDGTAVAEVIVTGATQQSEAVLLRAGRDTLEGLSDTGYGQHGQPRRIRSWRDNPEGGDFLTRIDLEHTVWPVEIEIQYLLDTGHLILRGLTLVNGPTATFRPVTVAPEGRMKLVHSGDVKIYENRGRLPRAFIVHRARVPGDDDLALRAMAEGSFAPSREVVLADGEPLNGIGALDQVAITFYSPERIGVEVNASEAGYLVLTDAFYPGWRAWVDRTETTIRRADVLFRAVWVPSGRHQVVFSYEPWSLRVGATISMFVAFVLAPVLSWRMTAYFSRRKSANGV